MTQQEKNKIYDAFKVHIQHGSWSSNSTCAKENCKNHDKYMIFIGGTQLSNLNDIVCKEHLAEYIDKAILERKKIVSEQISRIEKRELTEALKLVRKTKLNEIGI